MSFEEALSKKYLAPNEEWVRECFEEVDSMLKLARSLDSDAWYYQDLALSDQAFEIYQQAEELFWSIYPLLEEVPASPEESTPGSCAHNRAFRR